VVKGDKTDSACIALPLRRAFGGIARIIKKTRTTPDDDLALARKRQKELEQ
jgi:phage-related protein